jgi:hypothetical protein
MRRIVVISMIVGFAVPIIWGVLGFALFSAPQSQLTDLYWDALHVTSPAWLITPSSPFGAIVTPFLNALFYGGAAILLTLVARALRRQDDAQ